MIRAALIVLAILLLPGCAGGVQGALSAQATILVEARPARVDFYEAQHARCMAQPALPEYRECMLLAVALASSADAYRFSLESAQATLRAVDSGGDVPRAIACAVDAARDFVEALRAAHVPIPAEVDQIAAMIPEGVCDAQ